MGFGLFTGFVKKNIKYCDAYPLKLFKSTRRVFRKTNLNKVLNKVFAQNDKIENLCHIS